MHKAWRSIEEEPFCFSRSSGRSYQIPQICLVILYVSLRDLSVCITNYYLSLREWGLMTLTFSTKYMYALITCYRLLEQKSDLSYQLHRPSIAIYDIINHKYMLAIENLTISVSRLTVWRSKQFGLDLLMLWYFAPLALILITKLRRELINNPWPSHAPKCAAVSLVPA